MLLKKSVRTAVLSALSILFLWMASIIPSGRLVLLTLTTLTMMLSIMVCGVRVSGVGYICVGLMCFLFVAKRSYALFYLLFFGIFPFVKLFAEQRKSRLIEYLIKSLYAVILLVVMFFCARLFLPQIALHHLAFLGIIAFFGFFVFDYILTSLLQILHKLRNRINL